MTKKHMKALTVPVTWPINRKKYKFVVRPFPGKSFQLSMPLALVFREMLKYCKTTKEAKTILLENEILVDGRRKKDIKHLLGFMDVLSIPKLKEHYRMLINTKKKLTLLKIPEKEATYKICKIIGKKILKGAKTQLNLFDSRNIIVKKDNFKVGDSIIIELPSQGIIEHLAIQKGNYAFLIGGNHVGEHGVIESISQESELVKIKTKETSFETLKKFVFVVGKEKPLIKLE